MATEAQRRAARQNIAKARRVLKPSATKFRPSWGSRSQHQEVDDL